MRASVFERGLITADVKDSSSFGAFLVSHVTQLLGFPILKSYQHILDTHIIKLAFPQMLAAESVTDLKQGVRYLDQEHFDLQPGRLRLNHRPPG